MLAVGDIHKLLVLLALLSTYNTCLGSSPHQPKLLTWEVTNQRHIIIWSVSKIAPPFTWWLDLYPDLCKMALVAPANWDLQSHLDPNVVPGDHRRGSFSEKRGLDPWGGCGTTNHRSMLRVLTFYVCPGPHQQPKMVNKCGGKMTSTAKIGGVKPLAILTASLPPVGITLLLKLITVMPSPQTGDQTIGRLISQYVPPGATPC